MIPWTSGSTQAPCGPTAGKGARSTVHSRTVTNTETDEQTRQVVRRLLERGEAQRATARLLGVSRETLLAIAFGARVSRGSMALVRERIRAMKSVRSDWPPPEAA